MRLPFFTKTIRFRLTVMYSVLLLLLGLMMIGGINLAMQYLRPEIPDTPQRPMGHHWADDELEFWQETMSEEREKDRDYLRNYSLIGLAGLVLFGAGTGYFLSGQMLKPVDRVTATASRISHTNLKERLREQGPEDEIKRLADTFDEMLERLDGAFESQKQFLQDASHELRTPLAIAQTNIEVLKMQEQRSPSDYDHLLQVLTMSLERMNSINDNLLLLSEGEQTQYRWAGIDMTSLLRDVVIEYNVKAAEAGIHLEADLPSEKIRVKGDTLRLKQAVMNLVDNAIKYNQTGGTVRLSTSAKGSVAFVTVEDTGIGISESDLSCIFDRFYRADKSRSRNMGGSGLGLAIVKKIIEDHGGSVSVESTLGEGSAFRIELPLYINN
ncbi:MAG: HAMP domain-containing sensor histidine kinase [Chloroflexota bacterium]|nr:HAMP domain-containing sensor histidine kinase [Chloroflexota bacterium]